MNVLRRITLAIAAAAIALPLAAAEPAKDTCESALKGKTMKVKITTSMGPITAELDNDKAPGSVANFVKYVESGHYNGTIFHRVIDGFMIQGGGFTKDMKQKPTEAPIKNEAGNGLKNEKYTLAMARTGVVDSATAQFFINVKDNEFLNHKDGSQQGFGYAVFGKVVEGKDVVDKIAKVATSDAGMFQNVPTTPVVIEKVECL
jgi:cyclophilin family peptidyl-prolyl cis-trans isomerase